MDLFDMSALINFMKGIVKSENMLLCSYVKISWVYSWYKEIVWLLELWQCLSSPRHISIYQSPGAALPYDIR